MHSRHTRMMFIHRGAILTLCGVTLAFLANARASVMAVETANHGSPSSMQSEY